MSKRLINAAALEQRLSALQGNEWDSESEAEIGDESVIPLNVDATRTSSKKKAVAGDDMTAVVYVGHIPHGFYEDQMRGFFSQFGDVRFKRRL
jgi:hypothetical protein